MGRPKVRRVWNTGRIEKAANGGVLALANSGPKGGIPRRFGLMEALNLATDRGVSPPGFEPMPRSPYDDGPFGPGQPIEPAPIDPLNPQTGRPEPRVWEYPQSWNLPGNNRREVPWQVLRAAASGVDIIRRCIEVRKAHVADLQWSWSVRASVVEDAYNADRAKGYEDIASHLREQHAIEIKRLTARWERPWPHQDWTFLPWIKSVMEELPVIDTVVIYPRMSLGGDVLDLELVDGATIKPLLDYRGIRPEPPYPAYQQEIFGFPRGEWAASTTLDENGNAVVDNGFAASEMYYFRSNPRITSPYGLSAVEQALISARLYLKRQGWMLAEYDDGSTPLTVWELPEDPSQGMTVKQRREWEQSINAELAGQEAARHRMKVGVPGWKVHQLSSADERYKPDFDLFLVKLVAGHFGVTATELGFSETTGLGSAGWQDGQAEVGGRVGTRPDVKALTELINGVSRQFLNAPPELEFSFIDPANENDKDSDSVADSQLKRGTITLNDDRRRLKQPLFSFPEADMPMLVGVGTAGYVFLDGAKQAAEDVAAAAVKAQEATAEGTTAKVELEGAKLEDGKQAREEDREFTREQMQAQTEQADTTKAALAEVAAFRKWRKDKPNPKRPFVFKAATPDDWPELGETDPTTADFGGDWTYLIPDLAKGTWLDWNAANPTHPKDHRGRWVKASALATVLEDLSKVEPFSGLTGPRTGRSDLLTGKVNAHSLGRGDMILDGGEPFNVEGTRRTRRTGRWAELTISSPSGETQIIQRGLNESVERVTGGRAGGLTKAADPDAPHTGAMVALMPTEADAARLAVDGGEPVEELHVTLRYLGKGADFGERSREHLIRLVRDYAKNLPMVTAEAFNVAIFNPTGDEPCIVLGMSGDQIVKAHNAVEAAIEDYGADLPEPHKPFIPHLTLAYTGDVSMVEQLVDRVGPITFDRLRVAFGGVIVDIPLAAAITKAAEPGDGGADPKGPTPPDQRWPGWEQDLALAAAAAAAITAAMAAGLTTTAAKALADSFLHWARSWQPGQPAPDVVGWLRATTDLPERIEQAITQPIVEAWTQAYMVGERSAEAMLELLDAGESPRAAVSIQVDWAGWQPGDVAAARRILTEDGSTAPFEELLRDFGITIKRIAANRLDLLAAVLADGLELGKSPDEIARALTGLVGDPKWAYMTAVTETNRAMSAATLDSYVEAGIVATSWMTALDQRVCPICYKNEFEAPGVVRIVPIGQRYPSNDLHPPGHPRCRCTLVPVLELDFLGKAYNPKQLRHLKGSRDGGRWAKVLIPIRRILSRKGDHSKPQLAGHTKASGVDLLDTHSPAVLASTVDAAAAKHAPHGHSGGRNGPNGDEHLTAIVAMQRYDGLPPPADRQQLDKLVSQGHIELHRGAKDSEDGRTAESFHEQWRTGSYYSGYGIFGNGTYAASSAHTTAEYAVGRHSAVIRMALSPDAKVADWDDLEIEHETFHGNLARGSDESKIWSDPGRYAAARGYDAIMVHRGHGDEEETDYVILNRTMVTVQVAS